MPPDQAEVRRWLLKARHDWSAARKVFSPDAEETDVAAYHCQQAVEKMLKAYWVGRNTEFEKVHDLGYLPDQCALSDKEFETLRVAVEPLTVYAIAFGYPGPADPTSEDVRTALQVVERVWAFTSSRLPGEVLP
jgi:HEPN domain-containing protein